MSFALTPLSPVLGAEITGLSLEDDLTDAVIADLVAAWGQHQVLVFRGQTIGDAPLLRFAEKLGALDPAPYLDAPDGRPKGFPDITVVSNVIENGVPTGSLGAAELAWHSDMTYLADPPVGCVLHAWEVPAGQGATWFSSLRAATASLPADLRARLPGLSLRHDALTTSAGTKRAHRHEQGAEHPLLYRHPSWDEDILLLGRRPHSVIPQLSPEDSDALLDALWAHVAQPPFAIRHDWRPGDVVVWDNLLTLHRRDAFDPALRRTLHRAQVRRLHPQWRRAA